MNKHECRKQWLRALRAKEGTVAALAEKLGTDPNYISSLLGPSSDRDVGDDLAKRVEEAYNLPRGAVDLPSEGAARIVQASHGLTDGEIEEVLDFIRFKKSIKN